MQRLVDFLKKNGKILLASSLTLALITVFFVFKGGKSEKMPENTPNITAESTVEITKEPTPEPTEDPIKINTITELPAAEVIMDKLEIEKNKKDLVKLNYEQAKEYFGTELHPVLPEKLIPWDDCNEFEIYKSNGGTGDVYSDVFIMNYSDETMDCHVNIEGAKDRYHIKDIENWYDGTFELSLILGEQVYLAHNKQTDYYFAEFVHNGVGFRMIMAGLSKNEVITAVESLLK